MHDFTVTKVANGIVVKLAHKDDVVIDPAKIFIFTDVYRLSRWLDEYFKEEEDATQRLI